MPLGPSMVDIGAVLDVADGILLSGSLSNVEPSHYGDEAPLNPDTVDRDRDALTLAADPRWPSNARCRCSPSAAASRSSTSRSAARCIRPCIRSTATTITASAETEDMDLKFGPVHPVTLTGELKKWLGNDQIMVNSLHWQGISKLAPTLVAEAFAEDGLVEAIRGPAGQRILPRRAVAPRMAAKERIPSPSSCSSASVRLQKSQGRMTETCHHRRRSRAVPRRQPRPCSGSTCHVRHQRHPARQAAPTR